MQRNAYIDNVKVLLIFLVVFGHMIQPFIADSAGMRTLYVWFYIFHMPVFVFVSGFFAKGRKDKGYIMQLVKKLIVPYFVFQVIYTGYYYMIGKPDWLTGLIYPHWSLWFLISLFGWHILLIFFKKLKPMHGILLALGIGVLIGYFSEVGHTLSISRTFVFFPFFLAGYWITEKQLMHVKNNVVKGVGVVVLVIAAGLIYYLPDIDTNWLLHSSSYAELGVGWTGGLLRMFVYFVSVLMGVSVLAWIPKGNLKGVTYLGTRTLYVYLLHGFVVQYFRQAEVFSVSGVLDVLGLATLSLGLVYLLSSKLTMELFQPLIEGTSTRLRKRLNET